MEDITTPVFNALLSKWRDQKRIEAVECVDVLPTTDYLSQHVLPRGLPVLFSQSYVAARSEDEIVKLLEERCGDLTIQIRRANFDAPYQYITDRQLREVLLREYLRDLSSNNSYAGNQKLPSELEAVLQLRSPSFGEGSIEPPAFWLGGGGSVTPLHKDSTDNFAFQLCGTKRWTLFPVRDAPFLYMERPVAESDFATSPIDPKTPDRAAYPLYAQAMPVVVDLHAGQMLYLPAGWGHHVENLSTSLMVNYWMSREHFAGRVL